MLLFSCICYHFILISRMDPSDGFSLKPNRTSVGKLGEIHQSICLLRLIWVHHCFLGEPVTEYEIKVFRYIWCFACNDIQGSSYIGLPGDVNCQMCCLTEIFNSVVSHPFRDVIIFLYLLPLYFNLTNGSFGWIFIQYLRCWFLSLDIMLPYVVLEYGLASNWTAAPS